MTLRLRLILSVVAIVAAGLVISDIATYKALRSFLITRVDRQLQASSYPVGRALLSSSGLGSNLPGAPPTPATPGSEPVPRTPGHKPGSNGGDRIFANDPGAGSSNSGGGTGRGVLVPPGTYGQIRKANGQVEGHLFFTYGSRAPAAPVIPTRLPGSGLPSSSDLYFSTTGGDGGASYQAVAKPLVDGQGTIVIAVPLTELDSTLGQLLVIEAIVSAVLLAALGVLSGVMVRRDLRPLESMTETAGDIAQGDLSSRVSEVRGGTEVAQLGRAFNTMLDRIEQAFAERAASEDRLRRFLADASHELRTPLTSIIGYAELFDLGVRDRPEELASSLRHIRDEAGRMGTLVDDLFLLAQLDHERPLELDRVDLTELVRRSVATVSVAEPNRPVEVVADGPLWVEGDGSRLRQVVDNLVVNAQRHTPPGSPVEVRLDADGAAAVLAVRDQGPGVDPADAHRIFEPFYRSDPSRSRITGGAGLGLAIVATIVHAHGGTITVQPGPGATFVVRLPLATVVSADVDRAPHDPESASPGVDGSSSEGELAGTPAGPGKG